MNIEVNVSDIDLTSRVSDRFLDDGDDSEGGRYQTLADLVAARLVKRVAESSEYPGFRQEVTQIRDEMIRDAIAPLIEQALSEPFRQSNAYGEPNGPATTLREVIVAQARTALTASTGDSYSSDRRPLVRKIVAEEVQKAFGSVVADEVKKARELVADQIGEQVAAAVKAGMKAR